MAFGYTVGAAVLDLSRLVWRRCYALKGECILLTVGIWDFTLRQAFLCALWPGSEVLINYKEYQIEAVYLKKKFDPMDASPLDMPRQFTLSFRTPTCFRSSGRTLLFPEWRLVLASFYRDWQTAGGVSLEDHVMADLVEGAYPVHYSLETKQVQFGTFALSGFTGFCVYRMMPNLASGARNKLANIVQISDYVGVGYKTTMGMGAVDIRL